MFESWGAPMRMVVVGNSPPWMTVLGIIAVIVAVIWWILARMKNADDARRRRAAEQAGHDVGAFQGEGFEAHSARPEAVAPSVDSDRDAAWRALFAPETSAERLAEIAAAHPEFAAHIAQHPNAYPELRAWAASQQQ